MSRSTLTKDDPRNALSFFRKATPAEIKSGTLGFVAWAVEPSGDYLADVRRGKAIAEELVAFMMAAPTNGNVTLLSSMMVDMLRFADEQHRGLMIGFGSVIGKFALLGGCIVGSDAIRRHEETQAIELAESLRADGQNAIADAVEKGRLA